MNYRHQFHAGNFADVFKHVVLVRLLEALKRKEKGFAYLETHAGAGRYDLRATPSQTTAEYRDGIARLWNRALDADLEPYLLGVRALNDGVELRYYPGSPLIARLLLREQDRMRIAELADDDCAQLRAVFAHDRRVTVRCGDGYAALRQWLPPPERRGLVLIDPAYEQSGEWDQILDVLVDSVARWAGGVYAVWYPLKAGGSVAQFKTKLRHSGLRNALTAELAVAPPDSPFRLNGCGMLIVNPPWRIDTEIAPVLHRLGRLLEQGHESRTHISWISPK
jgi:23S rRNA (adenine2030-N6)-methyltransferase